MTKTASEALAAFRTVQAFNAQPPESQKFSTKVNDVLALARREALASGAFHGATGWSGNVTLLCLLGYGKWWLCVCVRKEKGAEMSDDCVFELGLKVGVLCRRVSYRLEI